MLEGVQRQISFASLFLQISASLNPNAFFLEITVVSILNNPSLCCKVRSSRVDNLKVSSSNYKRYKNQAHHEEISKDLKNCPSVLNTTTVHHYPFPV